MTWFNQDATRAANNSQPTARPSRRNVSRNVLAEGRRENAEVRQQRAVDRTRISREAREGGLLSPGVAHLRNLLSLAQEFAESQPSRPSTLSESVENGANELASSIDRSTRRATRNRRIQMTMQANSVENQVESAANSVGDGLERIGARRLGAVTERAGEQLGNALGATGRWLAQQEQSFTRGASDGLEGLITTVGGVIANPIETAHRVNRLSNLVNPISVPRRMLVNQQSLSEVLEEDSELLTEAFDGAGGGFAQTYQDHGVSGVFGRGVFEALRSLLSGGASHVVRAQPGE